MSVRVETERLVLRPPEASDVQPMFEMHQDPDVVRFLGTGTPGDITVAWRNVAMMIGHWQMRGYGPWIITRREDGAIIGRAGLWHAEGGPGVELGWMIRRDAWGHGFATEAARAALDWAWEHVHTDRIVSVINADNHQSLRIAAKLGQCPERRDIVNGADVLTFAIRRPQGAAETSATTRER
jgi:RimJ/RimL family protein N-acetyltransferase